MKESSSLVGAGHDEESFESLGKDAISSVIAVSMSLIVIFASSITIIYLWKGEDGFVIERPSSALLSWQMEYMDLIGANNDSLTELDGEGVVVCVVDSGVDLDHPDLRGVELRGWRDSINGIEEPYDDEGHGTAMTGIIVSDGGLDGVAKGEGDEEAPQTPATRAVSTSVTAAERVFQTLLRTFFHAQCILSGTSSVSGTFCT